MGFGQKIFFPSIEAFLGSVPFTYKKDQVVQVGQRPLSEEK